MVIKKQKEQQMDEKTSAMEIQSYVRLAIPLMTKHNIPIMPKNYAVWYKYVSGVDSELSKTIDAIFAEGKPFTKEINDSLHRQFCTEGDENELKKLRADLRQILLTILRQVADLTGQTKGYESFIANSVNRLTEDAPIDEVKKVIADLIKETKTIGTFGRTIQNELKETTKALEVLKQDFERVKMEALVDFLTGMPNRKAFSESLDKSIMEARSENETLCLLLIDIDHFKKFNDEYGHLIGDEILRFIAKKIKELVRGRDCAARFGGEEFAVILPKTPLAGAEVVAETIRMFFSKTRLRAVSTSKNLGTVTVSIGVACYRQGEPSEQFIGRSDQALYLAKNTGRNRVATEADPVYNRTGSRHIGSCVTVDSGILSGLPRDETVN
jgi:diguanylate cyclase